MSLGQKIKPEELPYVKALQQRLTAGEAELAAVRSDLSADGSFRDRWIILTDKRVLVLPSAGDGGGFESPLGEIKSVQAKSLVRGGRVGINLELPPAIRLPYTASESRHFIEFARAVADAKACKRVETTPRERLRY